MDTYYRAEIARLEAENAAMRIALAGAFDHLEAALTATRRVVLGEKLAVMLEREIACEGA